MKYMIKRLYRDDINPIFDFSNLIAPTLEAVAIWMGDDDLINVEIWDGDKLILDWEKE
jgi:hypothetical protein